jgi:hypothetical protein
VLQLAITATVLTLAGLLYTTITRKGRRHA